MKRKLPYFCTANHMHKIDFCAQFYELILSMTAFSRTPQNPESLKKELPVCRIEKPSLTRLQEHRFVIHVLSVVLKFVKKAIY